MKIASPFRDYYDVVLANDRDPYPFYLRQPAEFESKERGETYHSVLPILRPHIPQPLESAGVCGLLWAKVSFLDCGGHLLLHSDADHRCNQQED